VHAPAPFRPRTGFWDTYANARNCSHNTQKQTRFPFPALSGSQKAPGAAEAHRFLKKFGPLFGLFFSLRPFGLVKHNGFGTFVFLHFYS
jgi:hypothetical protein